MGVDVGFEDPFILCCDPPPPSPEVHTPFLLDGFGIPDGRCTLDGIAIDCGWAFQLMDRGAAVQCPNNDCGPRVMNTFNRNGDFLGRVLSQPFQAFADGFSGFLPPGARYQGNGTWVIPGSRPSSEPPSLKPHAPRPGAGRDNRNPDGLTGNDEGPGGDIFGHIGATPQNTLTIEHFSAAQESWIRYELRFLRTKKCSDAYEAERLHSPESIISDRGVVIRHAEDLRNRSAADLRLHPDTYRDAQRKANLGQAVSTFRNRWKISYLSQPYGLCRSNLGREASVPG